MAVHHDIPDYVSPDRVFDFDMFDRGTDPRLKDDLHQGLLYLHREAPDIFWTPRNGGHWVVTRADDMTTVVMEPAHFSTTRTELPRSSNTQIVIPLNLDPPAHTPYRQILMRYFAPKTIKGMEDKIRQRARTLIDAVKDDGGCDFVADIAVPLPVSVFMEMIGWPLDRLREFRALVEEYMSVPGEARRSEIRRTVLNDLSAMLQERQHEPRDDMMSHMLVEEIDGRPISLEEVLSMCFFLFIAGLDTVANAAAFFFRILARSPELQARLAADPKRIPDFVNEGLRTCGVVNTPRIIKEDVELRGVQMRKDDIVIVMLSLAGLDDRVHDDPAHFDIDRKSHTNMIFGSGAHLCAGHYLARLELNVLVEEWIKAIPDFHAENEDRNLFRLGLVMALKDLPLAWPAAASGGTQSVVS